MRFQGGTTFPLVLTLVFVLMFGAVVYARQSMPSEGSGSPTLAQRWVASYGFRVCNESGTNTWLPNLVGTKDEEQVIDQVTGQQVPANEKYRDTGVNSDSDGVIHYFPISSKATGSRAKLGLFLDVYGVKLTDTKLEFPADQGGEVYDTSKMKCDGKEPRIRVRVWDNYAGDRFTDYVTDFKNIRIRNNGMAFAIAIAPNEVDIPKPLSAADLPAIAASIGADTIEGQQVTATTLPPSDTPTTDTARTDTPTTDTPTTGVPSSTEPTSTDPDTTVPGTSG